MIRYSDRFIRVPSCYPTHYENHQLATTREYSMIKRPQMPLVKVACFQRQNGSALLISVVVLLAMTVLALAATNSNQSQAFMVRNAQFRMEAFNASFAEIDAQINSINERSLADGVPDYVVALIDSSVGSSIDHESTPIALPQFALADDTYMVQEVSQTYRGVCPTFGEQVGAGAEKIRCSELLINSDSDLVNTTIESNQNQVFEYRTLAE